MERAVAALIPVVRRWDLPLNPEDLYEIAYAVLRHGPGDDLSDEAFAEIQAQVNTQLDEFAERMDRLYKPK